MKQVVIGFDAKGNPVVLHAPKKVEVIFKQQKRRTFTKRIKALWWNLRHRTA